MADEISLQDSNDENNDHKKTNFIKNCNNYFADYSSKTTVYGIKYLTEPNRPIIEKVYWSTVLFTLFVICTVLIAHTWQKWNESPIINFAHSSTPIWQIPFPAVTICSETKVKQREYNFTNYFHQMIDVLEDSLTDDEKQTFSDTALVCDNHLYKNGSNVTTDNVMDHLTKIAPHLEEMLSACKINSQNKSCAKLFFPLFTDDGLCFTYNMLNNADFFTDSVYLHNYDGEQKKKSEGWTLENGYPGYVGRNTYPNRALFEGIKGGMFLLLRANMHDLDYICRGPIQGFKVILHHPAETPRLQKKFIQVPLNQSVVVMVKPEMTTASSSLKNYDLSQRKCFFDGEKPLKYFRTYTQDNCHMECVADYTLTKCGCVGFYMPRENSTKICGAGKIQCMHEAHNQLIEQEVDLGISRFNSEETADSSTTCNCLPSCTSITYNAEISHNDLDWPKVFEAFKVETKDFPEGILFSRLTIFFKDKQFVTTEKRKLYDRTDFLANCGGLLALFIGFSIFSFFEIFYFLTVRLIINTRKYGLQFWSGSRSLSHERLRP